MKIQKRFSRWGSGQVGVRSGGGGGVGFGG